MLHRQKILSLHQTILRNQMFFTVYHILQDFSITDCASAQTIKILIGSRGTDEKTPLIFRTLIQKQIRRSTDIFSGFYQFLNSQSVQYYFYKKYDQIVQRIKDIKKPFCKVRMLPFFTVIKYSHTEICCHKSCKHNQHKHH